MTAEGFLATHAQDALAGVDCRGLPYTKRPSDAASRARVHAAWAAAARDALDRGVDLLVTDDPAIVSYAAHNDSLLTFALPWDRTYVLLTSESAPQGSIAALRLILADRLADAVRADFRVSEAPFWWESPDRCGKPTATTPLGGRSSRVVYLHGDRIAQGLAERLVALTGRGVERGEDSVFRALLPKLRHLGTARATAAALSPSEFAAALHAGDDLAYVLPLPRFANAPCNELTALLRAAPWLQSVTPLIDTRNVAIVRRGRVGLRVDADGSLRLLNAASQKDGKP
jgi:hypothetical protein